MGGPEKIDNAPSPPDATHEVHAFLESLTGPSRGEFHWLSDNEIMASVGADRKLKLRKKRTEPCENEDIATLTWGQEGYTIDALADRDLWVNGRKVGSVALLHGDMIEFGEAGPMSRYRLCSKSYPAHRPVEDILSDAIAYARTSRRPLSGRVSRALRESARRMLSQTTVFFRIYVILALLLIFGFGYMLYQNDLKLQANLESEARRIEAVTLTLAQTREEALTPDDLDALQAELESRLTQNTQRLGTLEHRSEAAARVITASAKSIAFIQGAYGLRHIESGQLLRHMQGPDGAKLQTPFGQPWIEPHGTGPPAEFQFTGTGFLLKQGPLLVTNRHVALPWTSNTRKQAYEDAGLQPEMLRLLIYFPDQEEPVEAKQHIVSDDVDLAILSLEPFDAGDRGLQLADMPPRPGQEIFLLGYPTGLKALLAQAGPGFLGSLEKTGNVGFWTIAQHLSARRLIKPLASRGIVAQSSPDAVAYDAETTVGGSGGPALNRNGRVVAINAAILPEFGGSNIGVPVSHLQSLIQSTEAE